MGDGDEHERFMEQVLAERTSELIDALNEITSYASLLKAVNEAKRKRYGRWTDTDKVFYRLYKTCTECRLILEEIMEAREIAGVVLPSHDEILKLMLEREIDYQESREY